MGFWFGFLLGAVALLLIQAVVFLVLVNQIANDDGD